MDNGNLIEEALEYTRAFAEEIRNGIQQITDAGHDSKTTITNQHDHYKTQLQEYAQNYVEKVKAKAEESKCEGREALVTNLNDVVLKVYDRWDQCVAFTTKVEELGYFLRNTSQQFTDLETAICNAIQDVARCKGGFVGTWSCLSSELRNNAGKFAKEGRKLLNIVSTINTFMQGIVQLFLSCFTNSKANLKTLADQVLISHCNISL